MSGVDSGRVRKILSETIGPAPWYWETFPTFRSLSGQRFTWTHHGTEGPVAHLVTLGLEQEPAGVRLALNTYCRPFLVPPHFLGIWCPEGRSLRLACFDPDQLKAFDVAEVAGWFKQSSERIYASTAPVADFDVPLDLGAGTHKIDAPAEFRSVDELILPTSYKAMSNDDPAFALFVFYLQAGLVEVLPQKWFTAAQYRVGAAVDHEGGARSRVTADCRRMFRGRDFSSRRRRLPTGRLARAHRLTLDPVTTSLQIEELQGVKILRITSRDGTNRLTSEFVRSLTEAIAELAKGMQGFVITGCNKSFSAGADLEEIAGLDAPLAYEFAKMGQRLMRTVADFPAPVYAAISGYCMGGGLDLALACSHRIASSHAVFGHRGAALGLITGWGGTQRLPRLVRKGTALEMFVAAEKVNAGHAFRIGLVDGICEEPVQECVRRILAAQSQD